MMEANDARSHGRKKPESTGHAPTSLDSPSRLYKRSSPDLCDGLIHTSFAHSLQGLPMYVIYPVAPCSSVPVYGTLDCIAHTPAVLSPAFVLILYQCRFCAL